MTVMSNTPFWTTRNSEQTRILVKADWINLMRNHATSWHKSWIRRIDPRLILRFMLCYLLSIRFWFLAIQTNLYKRKNQSHCFLFIPKWKTKIYTRYCVEYKKDFTVLKVIRLIIGSIFHLLFDAKQYGRIPSKWPAEICW